MRQSITTTYVAPTNTKGARIKASTEAGSVTLPYDYGQNHDASHHYAAKALAEKYGWVGVWAVGADGKQRHYVWIGRTGYDKTNPNHAFEVIDERK